MYEYEATVLRVIDGDTLRLSVDLGFDISFSMTVRLAEVDTWEMRGDNASKGLNATIFVKTELPSGKKITIKTIKDKQGKYGRYLVKISYIKKGVTKQLAEELFRFGHLKT